MAGSASKAGKYGKSVGGATVFCPALVRVSLRIVRGPLPGRRGRPMLQPTMDARGIGLFLMAAGLVLLVVGALAWSGLLAFFGRLPGDFRYEGEHARVYVPLASMLLLSLALSALAALQRRFF